MSTLSEGRFIHELDIEEAPSTIGGCGYGRSTHNTMDSALLFVSGTWIVRSWSSKERRLARLSRLVQIQGLAPFSSETSCLPKSRRVALLVLDGTENAGTMPPGHLIWSSDEACYVATVSTRRSPHRFKQVDMNWKKPCYRQLIGGKRRRPISGESGESDLMPPHAHRNAVPRKA